MDNESAQCRDDVGRFFDGGTKRTRVGGFRRFFVPYNVVGISYANKNVLAYNNIR